MSPDRKAAADTSLARRRAPTQQRSRNTVDSILQATEQLVRTQGFSNVGTRQIAERAGISIGSLYQYFPTYQAILLTWYETVAERAARNMKLATVEVLNETFDEALQSTIGLLLDTFEKHALVLIRMPREVPEIETATQGSSFECLNRSSMRVFFSQHTQFNPRDTDRHIFFIENILMSNLRRFVTEKPRYLSRAAFISQLCRILSDYLKANQETAK